MASQLNKSHRAWQNNNEDSDTTDDEMYDDYDAKKALLPSSDKGDKQASTATQTALDELTVVNRAKDIDEIQRFIGRIKIEWKGLDSGTYSCGTGTTFQNLMSKYYVILTCAHNLLRKPGQPAIKLFFLPEGDISTDSDEKKDNESPKTEPRLECIVWEYNPKYDTEMRHCPNDIGLILCYDGQKYYKKLDLEDNVDDIVQIAVNANKEKIKRCNIYGYPVGCNGTLRGSIGTAQIGKDNSGEWQYSIRTFPGHSGSAMYVWDNGEEVFKVYGVHTFGDLTEQQNMGVKLTEEHKAWISETIQWKLIPAMDKHNNRKARRAKAEKQRTEETVSPQTSELEQFLKDRGIGEYYKNFADRGCHKLEDLIKADSDELLEEFLITEYNVRLTILEGLKARLKAHFAMEFYTAKHGKDLQFINGNIVKHNGNGYKNSWNMCVFGKEINNRMCNRFSVTVRARKGPPEFRFGYITSTIENSVKDWNNRLGYGANEQNCRAYYVYFINNFFQEGRKPLPNYKAPNKFKEGDTFKCVFNFGNNELIIYHNGTKAETVPILDNSKMIRFAISPYRKDSEIEVTNYALL